MNYKPNLKDPRIQRRCRKALGFVKTQFRVNEARPYGTQAIDKYLGQQQHRLSQWLRSNLLEVVDNHWNYQTGKCKRYKLNIEGLRLIEQALEGCLKTSVKSLSRPNSLTSSSTPSARTTSPYIPYYITSHDTQDSVDFLTDEHKQELLTGLFNYYDKSYRLWHPMQNARKEQKQQALANHGYRYEYDIENAMPTILLQLANKYGLDKRLELIENYVCDPDQLRNYLKTTYNLTSKKTKNILSAMSYTSNVQYRNRKTQQLFDRDEQLFNHIMSDPVIVQYRQEFKQLFAHLKLRYMVPLYITNKNGKQSSKRLNSSDKSMIYYENERKIQNCVANYCKQKGIRIFLEHDGWTTDKQLPTDQILKIIKQQSGFTVKLTEQEYAR